MRVCKNAGTLPSPDLCVDGLIGFSDGRILKAIE